MNPTLRTELETDFERTSFRVRDEQ